MKKKSQNEMVLDYLKKNKAISTMEAFTELRITRLSARIFDLRQAGHKIDSIDMTVVREPDDKIRFTLYVLKEAA